MEMAWLLYHKIQLISLYLVDRSGIRSIHGDWGIGIRSNRRFPYGYLVTKWTLRAQEITGIEPIN